MRPIARKDYSCHARPGMSRLEYAPAAQRLTTLRAANGQDYFINFVAFHSTRAGVFLDIGCNDGIDGSNSYFFEKQLGWRGACIEADPKTFSKIRYRSNRMLPVNAAVGPINGLAPFLRVHDSNGGLSGLTSSMDTDPNAAWHRFGRQMINVRAITPAKLLSQYYSNETVLDTEPHTVHADGSQRIPPTTCTCATGARRGLRRRRGRRDCRAARLAF